ncbi:hypothetical protein GYH30_035746 [Glycine max]|nr:hypothetical protein GYH30_035746 [Glycine max]
MSLGSAVALLAGKSMGSLTKEKYSCHGDQPVHIWRDVLGKQEEY